MAAGQARWSRCLAGSLTVGASFIFFLLIFVAMLCVCDGDGLLIACSIRAV